jgi:nicotinate-nucleotide adenylyltransferase
LSAIGLFGGTFDPVHRAHLEIGRAAARRYNLQRIEFIVSDIPPHKRRQPITPFLHRYAMVALALRGHKAFFPSTLEAPDVRNPESQVHYSIETVRRVKRSLKKSDRLFFLIGMDAFVDIATWREPEALLRECEFIVVSRPGFRLADIGRALPPALRPSSSVLKALGRTRPAGELVHAGVTIHLLDKVNVSISATTVRRAVAQGRSLGKLVPAEVAEYIKKMNLYREESQSPRLQSNLQNH